GGVGRGAGGRVWGAFIRGWSLVFGAWPKEAPTTNRQPPTTIKVMSRVGKKVIEIPKDVKVNVNESEVAVEGPKGKLAVPIPRQWRVSFKLEDGKLTADRQGDE